MKYLLILTGLACAMILPPVMGEAQTNAAPPPPNKADKNDASLTKHVNQVLAALHLDDSAKEGRVRDILAGQIQALRAWHAAQDAQIKPLWNDFNKARSAQNVAGAHAALEKIDAVYAGFKAQHDKFLSELAEELTPEQVEAVKDALTVNKVKVTYNVYLQIFPTLTSAQKAVVLEDLKQAREQAIDCDAMAEKSAFFKKYKIRIEDDYLTAEGYNPKQARIDFAAKSKQDAAAKQ